MCHRCDRVRCKGVRRRNAAAHLHPAVARRYATLGGSSSLSSSLLGTGEWRPSLGPTRRATTSTERRIDALTSTTRGIDALTSTMRGIGCRCCSPSNRATGYRELRHDGTQVCQFTAAVYSPTPSTRRRCFEIRHLHNLRILAAAAVTCHVAKTMVPSQPLRSYTLHRLHPCSGRRGDPQAKLVTGPTSPTITSTTELLCRSCACSCSCSCSVRFLIPKRSTETELRATTGELPIAMLVS